VKALVLCAGLGTRLRPFTFSTAKHLMPVANKPVLVHAVESLRDAGAGDLGVVVSSDSRPQIQGTLGDGSSLGVHVRYVEQTRPRGLGDATRCGRDFVGDEDFLLYLGDTLLPEGLGGLLRLFRRGAAAALMLKPVDDPRGFGLAVLDGDRVTRLVEKPSQPPSNLAIAGAYAFTREVFASIERIEPSWRGEVEITDAIQDLVDRGFDVRGYQSPDWWKDAGNPDDLIEANSVMLDRLRRAVHGHVDERSRIEGQTVIGRGARVRSSLVRGPVIVGEGAVIEEAEVGPHVAVGDHAQLSRCIVRDSLIMNDAVIADVARPLVRCVVGRKAEIRRCDELEMRAVLGDCCRVQVHG
jgi:glucose-1-phosphate thymidylyltransferase